MFQACARRSFGEGWAPSQYNLTNVNLDHVALPRTIPIYDCQRGLTTSRNTNTTPTFLIHDQEVFY